MQKFITEHSRNSLEKENKEVHNTKSSLKEYRNRVVLIFTKNTIQRIKISFIKDKRSKFNSVTLENNIGTAL